MNGLRPGGRALVIRSGLAPENLGREVEVEGLLGFYLKGEKIELGQRFVTVTKAGRFWMVRGVHAPLTGVLQRTRRRIDTWELPAHSSSLLPLEDDDMRWIWEEVSRRLGDSAAWTNP